MTIQTLQRKISRLDDKLRTMQRYVYQGLFVHAPQKSSAHTEPSHGLSLLSGMWKKKPRTLVDLARVRKVLWR